MRYHLLRSLSPSVLVKLFGSARKPLCVQSNFGHGRIAEPKAPRIVYFATFASNILGLMLPLAILQVYDRIIPRHANETLLVLSVALLAALAADFVLRNVRSMLMSWQASRFVTALSDEAVSRILFAPRGAVEQEPSTTHLNRYASIGALGDFYAGQSRLVAIDIPFVAIGLAVMGLVGGTVVLVPICLFVMFSVLSARRGIAFRSVIEQRSVQENKKYDFVAETLTGILSVKAMAMEPQMLRRFERLQQSVSEITAKSMIAGQSAQTSAIMYGSISQIVVVVIGAIHVINDQMSMGALACSTMLSGQILQPLLRMISLWTENEAVEHRRTEIMSLFALPNEQMAVSREFNGRATIKFDKVTFTYPFSETPVFKQASFVIPAGSILALQGASGSGRSTLLNVLRGSLAPTSGNVEIGGIDTQSSAFAALKSRIAYVGGTPIVFRGTILENLTLFRPVRNKQAYDISKLIGLDKNVHVLPDGFDTKLGEGISDELPASLLQQICIARALTGEPEIIILDEANSALDRKAEPMLINALQQLRGSKTIVVSTHRPSILAIGDIRLSINDGAVELQRPNALLGRDVA